MYWVWSLYWHCHFVSVSLRCRCLAGGSAVGRGPVASWGWAPATARTNGRRAFWCMAKSRTWATTRRRRTLLGCMTESASACMARLLRPTLPCMSTRWTTQQSTQGWTGRTCKGPLESSPWTSLPSMVFCNFALPCSALPCPALPCPALPCPVFHHLAALSQAIDRPDALAESNAHGNTTLWHCIVEHNRGLFA